MTPLLTYKLNKKQALLILDICCGLLLLLFLYTAVSKLSNLPKFRDVLQHSPLLAPYAGLLSGLVPALETAAAILLFIPPARQAGLIASAVMLLLFTAYIIYMLLFSRYLPCSCGGVLEKMSWGQHVIFNICCLGIALTGLWLGKNPRPPEQPP